MLCKGDSKLIVRFAVESEASRRRKVMAHHPGYCISSSRRSTLLPSALPHRGFSGALLLAFCGLLRAVIYNMHQGVPVRHAYPYMIITACIKPHVRHILHL